MERRRAEATASPTASAAALAGSDSTTEPSLVRVLIADDHPLFRRGDREGLARHFGRQAGP